MSSKGLPRHPNAAKVRRGRANAIFVRLNDAEHARILAAVPAYMNLSTWVRQTLLASAPELENRGAKR